MQHACLLFLQVMLMRVQVCSSERKHLLNGSVMISYAADSHTLYGELYRWPAATWPEGSMLQIKEWDTGKPLGEIPQVRQTYSVVGNMNEHQVAITESTFGGRPELVKS